LDRLSEFALLLLRNSCDTGRNDLAALRNVALQKTDVLVVDLWSVCAREWASLTTTVERATSLGRCFSHDQFSLCTVFAWTTWTIVTVALLHHSRWAFFVCFNSDSHVTKNVFVNAHLTLNFVDRSCRSVDVHKCVVSLAVLLDAVCQGLKAPVFHATNFTAE